MLWEMTDLSQGKQMSDRYAVGILLALTGGCLDAYTYLLRGGVFANAQTGNIVLLGVNLARRDWSRAGYYLVPILTFAAGVLITELVRARYQYGAALHWRQIVLCGEIAALLLVAFLPLGPADMLANVLVSFVCALQVQSFRKVDGNSMATTMCTGNLRSGTELLCRYWRTGDRALLRKSMEYYGIILSFVAGAAVGGLLSMGRDGRVVVLPAVLLAVVFLLMFEKGRNGKNAARKTEE